MHWLATEAPGTDNIEVTKYDLSKMFDIQHAAAAAAAAPHTSYRFSFITMKLRIVILCENFVYI